VQHLTFSSWALLHTVTINIVFRERNNICTVRMLHLPYSVLPKRMLFKENSKPIRKYNRLYSRDPHLHIARTLLYWICAPSFPPLHFARSFVYWGKNGLWVSRHWDVCNSENGSCEYQVAYCGFTLVICGHFNRILNERFQILSGYCKERGSSCFLQKLYSRNRIRGSVHL
jgi:hypothetical protein